MQADANRAIEDAGGQVAGRSRHPEGATDFASTVKQIKASAPRAIGLCDITRRLTGQLGQFQAAGLFAGGRTVATFLPAITDVHAAGANASHGLILPSSFHWNQNDQARLFAKRFIAGCGKMPDMAHAAVRHYLRTTAITGSSDATQIDQKMLSTPVYFFGHYARLRIDGRLAADL